MEKPITILLADDDAADRQAFRWTLEETDHAADLRVAFDGEQAMRYLFGRDDGNGASDAPRPDVVVMDLNMPRVGGMVVLDAIRHDRVTRDIPVVIMSNSSRPSDKLQTHGLGARAFCQKPVTPDEYRHVIRLVLDLAKSYREVAAPEA